MPDGRGNLLCLSGNSQGWPSALSDFPRGFPCNIPCKGIHGYHEPVVPVLDLSALRRGEEGDEEKERAEKSTSQSLFVHPVHFR
jgi:hypothetical protein